MALLVRRFMELALLIFTVSVTGLVLGICLEVKAFGLFIGGVGLGFYLDRMGDLNLFVYCGAELLTHARTAMRGPCSKNAPEH